jgi:hypothetical protein
LKRVAERCRKKIGRDGKRKFKRSSQQNVSLVLFARWRERWRDRGITCVQRALTAGKRQSEVTAPLEEADVTVAAIVSRPGSAARPTRSRER